MKPRARREWHFAAQPPVATLVRWTQDQSIIGKPHAWEPVGLLRALRLVGCHGIELMRRRAHLPFWLSWLGMQVSGGGPILILGAGSVAPAGRRSGRSGLDPNLQELSDALFDVTF
jgi:hypothetical protein